MLNCLIEVTLIWVMFFPTQFCSHKIQQIIDRAEMKDKFILQPLTDIHL